AWKPRGCKTGRALYFIMPCVRLACMRGLIALIIAAPIVVLVPLAVNAQDRDAAFRNGLSAFQSGSFERARDVWEGLAKAGDARAQAGLGFMHYTGRGVPRDAARAAELFDRAANRGEPTAQLFLATMHFRGDGVARNLPLA